MFRERFYSEDISCCRFQKIDRKIDPFCSLNTFRCQWSRLLRTAAQNDGIKVSHEAGNGFFSSYIDPGLKYDAFLLHELLPSGNHALVELHIRNTIHQKSADSVLPLINGDRMPASSQRIRTGQAGRTAAYDCHLPSALPGGEVALHPALLIAVLDEIQLIVFHGDRVIILSANARFFAQRGTHPSGELRKPVSL